MKTPRVYVKLLTAVALVAMAGFSGSLQAASTTATYNLGPQDGGTTILPGVAGLIPWIAGGTLPSGSILRSFSVNANLDSMAPGSDSWASDLTAYVDPAPEAPGTAALLQVGGYDAIGTVATKMGWGTGDTYPPSPLVATKDVSALNIDLSTAQLSLGNGYSEATWSGTISVTYYGPASITSFGPGATIDDAARTIAWTVPHGTDLATLAPTFTLSSGTCVPASGVAPNFALNNPATYTVTDGATINTYRVTVTVALVTSPGTTINVNLANVSANTLNGTAYLAGGFAQAPVTYAGTTWNEATGSPATQTGLLDSEGNPTAIGFTTASTTAAPDMALGYWGGAPDVKLLQAGVSRVYNSGSGNTLHNRFTVTGLDPLKTYNIYMASAHNTPVKCSWRIGADGVDKFIANTGATQTAETWVAGDDYVAFYKIAPDAGGNIGVWGRGWAGSDGGAYSGLTLNGFQVVDATGLQSPENDMLTFNLGTIAAAISGTNVSLILLPGTDVSALAPTCTVSPYATVSPLSGTTHNFTSPVNYTVTAENGSTKTYRVTITFSSVIFAASKTLNVTATGTGAEILNDGILKRAYHFGAASLITDITVHGVLFSNGGEGGNFTDTAMGGNWIAGFYGWNGNWNLTSIADPAYRELISSMTMASSSSTIAIDGLTVGHTYRLQLISNNPRQGQISVAGINGAFAGGDNSPPEILTVMLVAEDSTLNMSVLNNDMHFNAYALHDLTPVSADAATSTVVALPTTVASDGVTTSTITVTLNDASSQPVPGKTVTLASSRGVTDTISAASGPSDNNGVVTFTVKSTTAGSPVFTATDTTDGVVVTQTATVIFSSAGTSAANSTVVASPTSVVADGVTTSTITVTLRGAGNNPLSGKGVTLAKTSGPGIPVISPSSATTDGSGVATFTVQSTTAGTDVFTATETGDNITVTQTASVIFTAGAVDAVTSTVAASPATVPADGTASSTITVTLMDASSNPVPGKTVTLASSRGATDTISAPSGASDASGVVTFTVKSMTLDLAILTATDTTDSVALSTTPSVTFTAVSAADSTVVALPASVASDGIAAATITVTLKDAYGNPFFGKTVTLAHTSGPGTPVITTVSGTTDASGAATFTVKSTTTGDDVFAATDVTDSNLPITQTATVTFAPLTIGQANATGNKSGFTVSATDLVNQGQATLTSAARTHVPLHGTPGDFGDYDPANTGLNVPYANDGQIGAFSTSPWGKNVEYYPSTQFAGSATPANELLPVTYTFTLNTTLNPAGYDIANITSTCGYLWNKDWCANQVFQVEITKDGSTWLDLGTYTYTPFTAGTETGDQVTQVVLSNAGGGALNSGTYVAQNVTGIRITYLDPGNASGGSFDGTAIKEIDVFGQASAGSVAPVLTITSITGPDATGKFTVKGTSSTGGTVALLKSTNVAAPRPWGQIDSQSATANTPFTFTVTPLQGETQAFFMLKQ